MSSTFSIRPLGCWSSVNQIIHRELGVAHALTVQPFRSTDRQATFAYLLPPRRAMQGRFVLLNTSGGSRDGRARGDEHGWQRSAGDSTRADTKGR